MIPDPKLLAEGTYITNGRRLGEVRRADEEAVVIEEGPVSAAYIGSVPSHEIQEFWRVVEFEPIVLPDYWLTKPEQAKIPKRKRKVAAASG